MATKNELRKRYLAKRQSLQMQDMHSLLAAMVDPFRDISIVKVGMTLSYQAIVGKKEVSPDVFEQVYLEEFNPRGICYPAANFKSGDMVAYLDDGNMVWESVGFGLTQPQSGKMVLPIDIDIVFVPLLAFDMQGNRLGYGKGFYDRYLQKCRPDVQKIGFCWFEPETTLPEIGAHDVPLNYCVTPHKLYVF